MGALLRSAMFDGGDFAQTSKYVNKSARLAESVRRLTPTECETLQAFPKGWTVPDIEHWETRSRRT
jgi:site-specific DNA-cytosine methylase